MAAGVVLFLYVLFRFPNDPAAGWLPAAVAAIVLGSWWMISVLITRVDASGVSWAFTWGWPGGRIALARIVRVQRTDLNLLERSSMGLHWTIWHGWLWNVAGAQAIEIFTTGGRRTTVGTDDPEGLLQAIERFRTGAA